MSGYARPRLVLSQCLELDACRYNGHSIRARIVPMLAPYVELLPVCPEVEIGLGVPRPPVRLVAIGGGTHLVQPATSRDLTHPMQEFSAAFLQAAGPVDGFLLKSRSPSCGIKDVKIYAAAENAPPTGSGPGLFAAAVLERFPGAAIEDEGRLTNFRLRHHFLTHLFALAALREVASMAELVRFHAAHKFLLLAHQEAELRVLGRIVANAERAPFAAVLARYRDRFGRALARPARAGAHVNVLQHAQGYVREGISSAEKQHFGELLEAYRQRRLPLSAPLAVVQSWIARFGLDYLAAQRYFDPYPRELMELTDSARASFDA